MYEEKLEKIALLDINDRPREKLINQGAESLQDNELLAILLGRGTHSHPLENLVNDIMSVWQKNRNQEPRLSLDELLEIKGLGKAKSSQLLAMLTLGKRWNSHLSEAIRDPVMLYPYIKHFFSDTTEAVVCVTLNAGNQILNTRLVSQGTINKSIVHPREILCDVIGDRASSFFICHNHPSGNLQPSDADKAITARFVEIADLIGIPLLDHIIYTEDNFFSFRMHNLLGKVDGLEGLI